MCFIESYWRNAWNTCFWPSWQRVKRKEVYEIISLAPEVYNLYEKIKIKKGDKIKVICGEHKGSEGKVVKILKREKQIVMRELIL